MHPSLRPAFSRVALFASLLASTGLLPTPSLAQGQSAAPGVPSGNTCVEVATQATEDLARLSAGARGTLPSGSNLEKEAAPLQQRHLALFERFARFGKVALPNVESPEAAAQALDAVDEDFLRLAMDLFPYSLERDRFLVHLNRVELALQAFEERVATLPSGCSSDLLKTLQARSKDIAARRKRLTAFRLTFARQSNELDRAATSVLEARRLGILSRLAQNTRRSLETVQADAAGRFALADAKRSFRMWMAIVEQRGVGKGLGTRYVQFEPALRAIALEEFELSRTRADVEKVTGASPASKASLLAEMDAFAATLAQQKGLLETRGWKGAFERQTVLVAERKRADPLPKGPCAEAIAVFETEAKRTSSLASYRSAEHAFVEVVDACEAAGVR